MSNLLMGGNVHKLHEVTLDQLWREAEQLGRVQVEQDYGRTQYEATITFYRPSGTQIRAKGCDTDALFALSKAVNEAREMGAGATS